MTAQPYDGPRDAGLRIRFWVLYALSGTVVAELPMASVQTLTTSLSGGALRASVDMNLRLRGKLSPDYRAINGRMALTTPGKYTIVATDDRRRVLGEWILIERERVTSDLTMPIAGVQWEAYPQYRTHEAARKFKSADSIATLRTLLSEVYLGANVSLAGATSGVSIEMDRQSYSGTYADVIREVTDSEPGAEWAIEITGSWAGDSLTSVTRTARIGTPVLKRSTSLVFEAGEPMTRQGNSTIRGGDDWTLYARRVIGIGSGSGSKQLISTATDSSHSAAGIIDSVRTVSFPDVTKKSVLDRLTQQALRDGFDMRVPWSVSAEVAKLAKLPQPGDQAQLHHWMSYMYPATGGPAAIDESVRIGEVSYKVDGPICETVEVKAA